MTEGDDFIIYLRDLKTELPNPFRIDNFDLYGAESFIRGGEELHCVDDVIIDFSKKLEANIIFEEKDTILALVIATTIYCSHCSLGDSIDICIDGGLISFNSREKKDVFNCMLGKIEKSTRSIKLKFKNNEVGEGVYDFHKQNILFTTDDNRLDYESFEKEMSRRLEKK